MNRQNEKFRFENHFLSKHFQEIAFVFNTQKVTRKRRVFCGFFTESWHQTAFLEHFEAFSTDSKQIQKNRNFILLSPSVPLWDQKVENFDFSLIWLDRFACLKTSKISIIGNSVKNYKIMCLSFLNYFKTCLKAVESTKFKKFPNFVEIDCIRFKQSAVFFITYGCYAPLKFTETSSVLGSFLSTIF